MHHEVEDRQRQHLSHGPRSRGLGMAAPLAASSIRGALARRAPGSAPDLRDSARRTGTTYSSAASAAGAICKQPRSFRSCGANGSPAKIPHRSSALAPIFNGLSSVSLLSGQFLVSRSMADPQAEQRVSGRRKPQSCVRFIRPLRGVIHALQGERLALGCVFGDARVRGRGPGVTVCVQGRRATAANSMSLRIMGGSLLAAGAAVLASTAMSASRLHLPGFAVIDFGLLRPMLGFWSGRLCAERARKDVLLLLHRLADSVCGGAGDKATMPGACACARIFVSVSTVSPYWAYCVPACSPWRVLRCWPWCVCCCCMCVEPCRHSLLCGLCYLRARFAEAGGRIEASGGWLSSSLALRSGLVG